MKTTLTLKRLGVVGVVGIAAMAAGCSDGGTGRTGQAEAFEIQLVGHGQGNLSSVLLPVAGVTATSRGQPLEVETLVDTVDLAANRRAVPVARVRVPAGTRDVDLSVQFDDAGGYESARASGAVEARGAEIRWHAPVGWLQMNGRATIDMDLRRSLAARGDSMWLIPSATVSY